MQPEEYVAARRGRLIEHAVALGCSEGEAPAYVDLVLHEQRRRIQRSDDPDPWVRAALERGLDRGASAVRPAAAGPGRPSPRLLVAGALLLVAALAVVALRQEPPPEPQPLPSVFGYDGETGRELLEDAGYEVALTTTTACEPRGRVVGTDPPAGEPLLDGAAVTLRTALPTGPFCEAQYPFRSAAWQLIDFARGGDDPGFARAVTVVVDGSPGQRLTGGAAPDLSRWDGALDPLVRAAGATATSSSGVPRLIVVSGRPPARQCGIAVPSPTAGRVALRIQLDPVGYGTARSACPVTVDVFRTGTGSGTRIDTVVVYTGHQDGGHHLAYAPPPWSGRPSAGEAVGPGLRLDP